MVNRDKNRASVVIWSISNEAKTSKKTAGPYYKAAVHRLRQLDKTRPISYVTNQDMNKDEAVSAKFHSAIYACDHIYSLIRPMRNAGSPRG